MIILTVNVQSIAGLSLTGLKEFDLRIYKRFLDS